MIYKKYTRSSAFIYRKDLMNTTPNVCETKLILPKEFFSFSFVKSEASIVPSYLKDNWDIPLGGGLPFFPHSHNNYSA